MRLHYIKQATQSNSSLTWGEVFMEGGFQLVEAFHILTVLCNIGHSYQGMT